MTSRTRLKSTVGRLMANVALLGMTRHIHRLVWNTAAAKAASFSYIHIHLYTKWIFRQWENKEQTSTKKPNTQLTGKTLLLTRGKKLASYKYLACASEWIWGVFWGTISPTWYFSQVIGAIFLWLYVSGKAYAFSTKKIVALFHYSRYVTGF